MSGFDPNAFIAEGVVLKQQASKEKKFDPDKFISGPHRSDGPTLGQIAGNTVKAIGGAAAGATEALNPVSGLETLGRAVFTESGGPIERLTKASEHTVTSLPKVAAGARAVSRYPFSKYSLSDLLSEEMATQKAASADPFYGVPETAANVGVGVASLGKAALNAPKIIKGTVSSLKNLSTAYREAKNANDLLAAKTALSDVLGGVAPEVGTAIVNRTKEVMRLVDGAEDGRSLFPLVKELRQHVQDTKEFVGPMVGAFRDLVFKNTHSKLDTSDLVGLLDNLQSSKALQGADNAGNVITTISGGDLAKIQKVRQMLGGIEKQNISPSDALLVTDLLDDWLRPVFGPSGGMVTKGNVQAAGASVLSGIRTALKDKIHKMYPHYAKVDEQYSMFKDAESLVGSRLDNMGAESTVANMFGANKTEFRGALEELLNRGDSTVKEIRDISDKIKLIPEPKPASVVIPEDKFSNSVVVTKNRPLTKTQKNANAANELATEIVQYANDTEFPKARDFFNKAANIIAARKIKETTNSGWGDITADKIRAIVDRYANEGKAAGRLKGSVVGGTLGAAFGILTGKAIDPSNLAAVIGGAGGANLAARVVGNIGARVGLAKGLEKGKQLTDIPALLNRIVEIQNAPKETQNIINDIRVVYKTLGPEMATELLYMIPVTNTSSMILERAYQR